VDTKEHITSIADEVEPPSLAESNRGIQLISHSIMQRQAKANEVALKGLYVDFLFDKLNLKKYR